MFCLQHLPLIIIISVFSILVVSLDSGDLINSTTTTIATTIELSSNVSTTTTPSSSTINSTESVDYDEDDEPIEHFNTTETNITTSTTPSPDQEHPIEGTEEYIDYLWSKLLKCGYDTCFNCFKQECTWCTSKAENCMKLAGETIWPMLLSTLKEEQLPINIDPPTPIKAKAQIVKVNETTTTIKPSNNYSITEITTIKPNES